MSKLLTAVFSLLCPAVCLAQGGDRPLAHMVFFELKQKTAANQKKLADACLKYLSGHEGTLYFSVGTRAEELKRGVNVTDFDVALHLVFRNKAAHDKYQTHPRHLEFIKKNKHLWKSVRVFDSYVVGPRAATSASRRVGRGRAGGAVAAPAKEKDR